MDEKLKAILANIQSLVDQATQLSGGAQSTATDEGPVSNEVTPDDVEKIMKLLKGMGGANEGGEKIVEKEAFEGKETPAEEKQEAGVKKSAVKKSDEGTHANDKAEAVVDDQGEVNDENIREVAKAIAGMLSKSKGTTVKKSTVVEKSMVTDSRISQEIAAIKAENQELRKSIEVLIDGFGLKTTVEKANEVKPSNEVRKSEMVDLAAVKKSIVDEVRGMMGSNDSNLGWGMDVMTNHDTSIRKSLNDAMAKLAPGIKNN